MPNSSSTTNSMASTNPTLTNMFTSLFGPNSSGPGAGAAGVNSLTNIANGQNIQQLNTALTANNKATVTQGISQLKEAFGSSGMGSSSSLGKAVGQYQIQSQNNLTQNLASSDIAAQGQTLSAANYLSQIFSSSANNYFNNQSSTSSLSPTQIFSALFPGGI